VSLDLHELRELLAAINQTDIAEFTLKSADFELTIRRGIRAEDSSYVLSSPQPAVSEAASLPLVSPSVSVAPAAASSLEASSRSTAATPVSPPSPPVPPPTNDRRLVDIISPMVGTFYRSPSPDDSPFVEVGDRVRKGQTVCIIEAMKLMNELEAEVGGEIVEILVQNGEPVEYGQPLMRVTPD
jgi:acetyl-CoA carboxylase biotin carboxyl carrier protein